GTGGTDGTGGAGGTGGTGGFGSKTGFTVDASGNIIDAAGNIVGSTVTGSLGPVLGGGGGPIFPGGPVPAKRGGAVEGAMRVTRAKGGRAGYDGGGEASDGDYTTADVMQRYKPPTLGGRLWNWLTSEHPPEEPRRPLTPREQAALGTASDVMGAKSVG